MVALQLYCGGGDFERRRRGGGKTPRAKARAARDDRDAGERDFGRLEARMLAGFRSMRREKDWRGTGRVQMGKKGCCRFGNVSDLYLCFGRFRSCCCSLTFILFYGGVGDERINWRWGYAF